MAFLNSGSRKIDVFDSSVGIAQQYKAGGIRPRGGHGLSPGPTRQGPAWGGRYRAGKPRGRIREPTSK